MYRRDSAGHAVLVILGFNKTPTSLTLQEPQGTWTLQAASWQREFGGQANDHPPDIIIIPSDKDLLVVSRLWSRRLRRAIMTDSTMIRPYWRFKYSIDRGGRVNRME